MKILIACEQSGVVRDAFRSLGHDAWSCDILPSYDMRYHYQCDVLTIIHGMGWDAMIAHPSCIFLTNSAAWANNDPNYDKYPVTGYHQKIKSGTLVGAKRRIARDKAAEFFLSLWNCDIPRVAIENPPGYMNTHPDLPNAFPERQIIHPHQFGCDASKATCLWLRGFPPLEPTEDYPPRIVSYKGKIVRRWSNQTDSGQNKLPPTKDRSSIRATTYNGIAVAMARQWGKI